MRRGLPGALAQKNFTPPLQPDLARHRLACQIADPRDLRIKRIKRKKRVAPSFRRKQRCQITVAIEFADLAGAVNEVVAH